MHKNRLTTVDTNFKAAKKSNRIGIKESVQACKSATVLKTKYHLSCKLTQCKKGVYNVLNSRMQWKHCCKDALPSAVAKNSDRLSRWWRCSWWLMIQAQQVLRRENEISALWVALEPLYGCFAEQTATAFISAKISSQRLIPC